MRFTKICDSRTDFDHLLAASKVNVDFGSGVKTFAECQLWCGIWGHDIRHVLPIRQSTLSLETVF